MPGRWWLLLLLLALAIWLVYERAYGLRVSAPVALVVLAVGGAVLAMYGRVVVAVDSEFFVAGRARLPLWAIGEVEALDAPSARLLRGPRGDPRAFLVVRSYAPSAVRVAVEDPADPVPYWLISTRHPKELADALRAGLAERR